MNFVYLLIYALFFNNISTKQVYLCLYNITNSKINQIYFFAFCSLHSFLVHIYTIMTQIGLINDTIGTIKYYITF